MSDDDNVLPFKGRAPPPPEDDDGMTYRACPECGHFAWIITEDFDMLCASPFCDFASDIASQE